MTPYKFASYDDGRTDVKPDTEMTRLLEKAATGSKLVRTEKDRVADILYGLFGSGSSTYKLAGWAWPMHTCLPRFLVSQYNHWQSYHAPDETSLRKALSGRVDEVVSV